LDVLKIFDGGLQGGVRSSPVLASKPFAHLTCTGPAASSALVASVAGAVAKHASGNAGPIRFFRATRRARFSYFVRCLLARNNAKLGQWPMLRDRRRARRADVYCRSSEGEGDGGGTAMPRAGALRGARGR